MTNIRRALEAAAGTGGGATYVDDVFDTHLWTGTSANYSIANGLDMDGEGGMVWLGYRAGASASQNLVFDTDTAALGTYLRTYQINAEVAGGSTYMNSWDSGGYTVGGSTEVNYLGNSQWASAFRKAPGFFDIVTYTGTGVAHAINHNLGSAPGMIIVKNRDDSDAWTVYHRSNTAAPETDYLVLNTTAATVDDATVWNDTLPTSTQFTVGTNALVNTNTENYVAYIFAHDDQIFGTDGDESIIQCGTYTGAASTVAVSLGWEPQYVITKATSVTSSWNMYDTMRGMPIGAPATTTESRLLIADGNNAESGSGGTIPTADGFGAQYGSTAVNDGSATYIYIAIRRPMKVPEAGTEVLSVAYDATANLNNTPPDTFGSILTDLIITAARDSSGNRWWADRMRGKIKSLNSVNTSAEGGGTFEFDKMIGVGVSGLAGGTPPVSSYNIARAPKFMDVVAYIGAAAAHNEAHNLTVAPEMIIQKNRNASSSWTVYHSAMGATGYMALDSTAADGGPYAGYWNNTSPTASVFTVGTANTASAQGYINYLFATLAGVSKVGSYTADATLTTIDCGFAAGARFIMIKRYDSTGDWYVYDTARGIAAGDDAYILMNGPAAAEVTGTDYVDPDNSGFQITAAGSGTINIDTATYIFLAIA